MTGGVETRLRDSKRPAGGPTPSVGGITASSRAIPSTKTTTDLFGSVLLEDTYVNNSRLPSRRVSLHSLTDKGSAMNDIPSHLLQESLQDAGELITEYNQWANDSFGDTDQPAPVIPPEQAPEFALALYQFRLKQVYANSEPAPDERGVM